MKNALYLLLLAALLLPAFAQKDGIPPAPEPIGPNGPFVVATTTKGDYKATDTYTVNDLVLHKGDRYVSMAAENQGNEPTPTSSLWLRLPDYKGAVTTASWGTASTTGGKIAVRMKGDKHYKSATSYGCGMTSDLLTVPSDSPPARDESGKPSLPAPKAKFTYQSGEQFSVTGVTASPAGYVCAGS